MRYKEVTFIPISLENIETVVHEVLEDLEGRNAIIRIGGLVLPGPRFAEELAAHINTFHFSNLVSNVPISDFHNKELTHIAIESRKRSSFNIYKSRGRLGHPFQVIPRFNHPRISSELFFFRNLRPTTIESILHSMTVSYILEVSSVSSETQHSSQYTSSHSKTSEISNAVNESSLLKAKAENNMSDKNYVKENCPKIVDVGVCAWGRSNSNTTPLTGFYSDYDLDTTVNNSSYSDKTKNSVKQVTQRLQEQERWRDDILSRVVRLEKQLGGCAPGLLDLYCAGFESAEIHAVWDDLIWLYGPDFDKQGPVNIEALEAYEESQEQVIAS